jgi:hypothetical protein
MGKPTYELLQWHIEGVADPQQGESRHWAASLKHLPVTDAEAIGNHVFLAQFPFRPVGSNFMAQCPKEPRILGRQLSAGTHPSKLGPGRSKTPRTKLRILKLDG